MKKTRDIRAALLQVTIVASLILLVSCNNQQANDSKAVAEERNEENFDDRRQEKDASFLVNAAEINMEEIQLGKLAQQMGRSSDIREMGKVMETAHSKSLADLTALAKSKQIAIPTSATENSQEAYRKLSDKSGDDFDKEYADLMVSKHKDAIDIFEKASSDCEDADIKKWATTSLPGLRTHLDHSEAYKEMHSEMYFKDNN